MARISFQLFSARHFDLATVLPHLAETGIREVEGFGGLYDDAEALRDTQTALAVALS